MNAQPVNLSLFFDDVKIFVGHDDTQANRCGKSRCIANIVMPAFDMILDITQNSCMNEVYKHLFKSFPSILYNGFQSLSGLASFILSVCMFFNKEIGSKVVGWREGFSRYLVVVPLGVYIIHLLFCECQKLLDDAKDDTELEKLRADNLEIQLNKKNDSEHILRVLGMQLVRGRNLFSMTKDTVTCDDQLDAWMTECDSWKQSTADIITKFYSGAKAVSFFTVKIMAASLSGSLNEKHNTYRLQMQEYCDELKNMIDHVG